LMRGDIHNSPTPVKSVDTDLLPVLRGALGRWIDERTLELHQLRPIDRERAGGHADTVHVAGGVNGFCRADQDLLRHATAEGARPTERTRVDHCDGPARLTTPRRHPGRDAGPDNDEIVMSFHRRLLQLRRTASPERPERCDRLSHFPALSLDQV